MCLYQLCTFGDIVFAEYSSGNKHLFLFFYRYALFLLLFAHFRSSEKNNKNPLKRDEKKK